MNVKPLLLITPELFLVTCLGAALAWSAQLEGPPSSPAKCAVIEKMGGEVQILDGERAALFDTAPHSPVPCGGWISVEKGWVILKHRNGFSFHIGKNSFVQISALTTSVQDTFVLYRGSIYAFAGDGSGTLKGVTPNARAQMNRGRFYLSYNETEEETQLVAFDPEITLENRFEHESKVTLKPGEMTSLNLKQLRVVPSTPRAVAQSTLKPAMDELHLSEGEKTLTAKVVDAREKRKFAQVLIPKKGGEASNPNRAIASENAELDVKLRRHFLDHITGGANLGVEKRKLMKELSQLKPEE